MCIVTMSQFEASPAKYFSIAEREPVTIRRREGVSFVITATPSVSTKEEVEQLMAKAERELGYSVSAEERLYAQKFVPAMHRVAEEMADYRAGKKDLQTLDSLLDELDN